MGTLVMNFGGAGIATPEHFSYIADLIIAKKKEYPRIVVVVNAMSGTTDQLIALAKRVHPSPPKKEYDTLLSTADLVSMALLAMALSYKNQEAVTLTGSQSGIITGVNQSEVLITAIEPKRIEKGLADGKIVIVAAFQGVNADKEITILGPGGADASAVAIGVALHAVKVEFFKDMPAIFLDDPKIKSGTKCYMHLTYQSALDIVERGSRILHPRAIRLAGKNGLLLHVRSFLPSCQNHPGAIIFESGKGNPQSRFYEDPG